MVIKLIRRNEVVPYYKKCCLEMRRIYNYLISNFCGDFVEELCNLRGYVGQEQRNEIERLNLGRCSVLVESLGDMAGELGFVSKSGNFLIEDRYIIPVEDIAGNIVALIGYYPDGRKYITTPSPFFSKECMFFNFRRAYDLSMLDFDGFVILVEGIFDCISLQSLGLPVIATMGATVSEVKGELLKLFRHVLAIPDGDETGRRSLNRYTKRGWKVPDNTTLVKLHGGTNFNGDPVKDMDDIVTLYEADDIREMLLAYQYSNENMVEIIL